MAAQNRGSLRTSMYVFNPTNLGGIPEARFQVVKLKLNVYRIGKTIIIAMKSKAGRGKRIRM